MLALLPIALLIFSAISVLLIQRLRKGVGYVWLFSVLITSIVFGIELSFRWRLPLDFWMQKWMQMGVGISLVGFRLDPVSWGYGFALSSICLAVILTAPARLQQQETVWEWSACLGLAAMGMLATMASTPLALLFTWTAIDFFELVVLVATNRQSGGASQVLAAFFTRSAGTMVVLAGILYSLSRGQILIWNQAGPEISLFLLIGCGLRLGVLPVHLPLRHETSLRRGLGNMLRLVSAASSLAPLSRLPDVRVIQAWTAPLLWLTAVAVLYCAVMWLGQKDELDARPYWLISLAGMAVACTIQGKPSASAAWGIALVLVGGVIFLYSARFWWVSILVGLGLAGLSGLPFTPLAGGWQGIILPIFHPAVVLFIISQILLNLGFLKHLRRPENNLSGAEGWIRAVYPVGFIVLIASHWLIGVIGWRGSMTAGIWWAGMAVTLGFLAAGGVFGLLPGVKIAWRGEVGFLQRVGAGIGRFLERVMSLEWLYAIFRRVFNIIERMVGLVSNLLEGDGGVLWVLVLLALFLSLTGGGRR